MKDGEALPPGLPGVGNAANYRAEHESSDEGEEDEVDEAFQSIVAQPRHGLDVVLQNGKKLPKENTFAAVHTHTHTQKSFKLFFNKL